MVRCWKTVALGSKNNQVDLIRRKNGRFGYSTRTKGVFKIISLVWSCIKQLLSALLKRFK